jgi:hypothetical protein
MEAIQAAIGKQLRSEYEIMQPVPDHIADLVRQFTQLPGTITPLER